MAQWIALLRGINVGGKNSLPMKELRSELESLKCSEVRTYIQSGNVAFTAAAGTAKALAKKLAARIESRHGFRPHVLVLSLDDLHEAVRNNPFPKSAPKELHFFFLDREPSDPDLAAMREAKAASENFKVRGRVFYLLAPEGIGRSKLAANAEKWLGVPETGRNFRTVQKIAELAKPEE